MIVSLFCIWMFFVEWLSKLLDRRVMSRRADLAIGGWDAPYLLRWYVIPRNRFFNIYLHQMLRSDDDRALHDHPWFWCSVFLRGAYWELSGDRRRLYQEGSVRFHSPWFSHRLVMPGKMASGAPVTLFLTGPRLREWGFHCPHGWRHWKLFTDDSGAKVGRGCN